MKSSDTKLQTIEFGDAPEDIYYCLIDRRVSPGGLDIEKMRLSDPRNIDEEFRKQGCLMMFTGDEIEELVRRGELNRFELRDSLFELAKQEGVI
ncbi:MAG: hypothetical protein GVY02_08870 [Bacteroidetes bacterium]|jgi:hypothetical protein|nr:hypothetical protein [Bacteroidota bacterium]